MFEERERDGEPGISHLGVELVLTVEVEGSTK